MKIKTERKIVLQDSTGVGDGFFLKYAAVNANECAIFDFWARSKGRKINISREHLELLLAAMKECEEEDANKPEEEYKPDYWR